MPVDGFVTSCSSFQQRLELFGKHITHAHRIHLYQFRKKFSYLTLQIIIVLAHLSGEVLTCQQGVKTGIDSSVNIGWEMGSEVVDTIQHQVLRQLVEDILYGMTSRVTQQESIHKLVTDFRQLLNSFTLKKKKGLILDFQVGKSQFRRTVLVFRRRHQLVDVLLQMNTGGKPTEHNKKDSHRCPAN